MFTPITCVVAATFLCQSNSPSCSASGMLALQGGYEGVKGTS
jgi:hypothetical protein